MYYIQPWMLAVIIPLACMREGSFSLSSPPPRLSSPLAALGQQLLDQLHLLNTRSYQTIGHCAGILGSSAVLAFSLEFSEFLLVSNTSSLTLSVSGIFKVEPAFVRSFVRATRPSFLSLQEIVMLYLAVEYNENQLNPINIVGLVICLTGIVFHCVLKFYTIQSTRATTSS